MRRWLPGLFALPLAVFLALPLLALALRAPWNLPTGDAWTAVQVSLRTSVLAALIMLVLGTPLAWFMGRERLVGRGLLDALVTLPVVLPPAAAGLGLLLALGRHGLLPTALPFTAGAVIFAQVYVAAPFFVRPLATAFRGLGSSLREAAVLDGAGLSAYFWQIALPLVRRPLIVALTLAWARALGEFGATALFAGNRVGVTQTLPLAIYLGFETDVDIAASLSLLLLLVAIVVISITLVLGRSKEA